MRRGLCHVISGACVAGLLLVPASSSGATRTCHGFTDNGSGSITNLRATGTTCTHARHVALGVRADTDTCEVAADCEILGYTCRITERDTPRQLLRATWRCTRAGGRRVTFTRD